MSDDRPCPRWMRRMISTARWVPPWQVVQRPPDSDALDVAREREHHRTGVALGTELDVLLDAVADDPGGALVAADVVYVAALAEDARGGGKGRPDLGHAAVVFDRGD